MKGSEASHSYQLLPAHFSTVPQPAPASPVVMQHGRSLHTAQCVQRWIGCEAAELTLERVEERVRRGDLASSLPEGLLPRLPPSCMCLRCKTHSPAGCWRSASYSPALWAGCVQASVMLGFCVLSRVGWPLAGESGLESPRISLIGHWLMSKSCQATVCSLQAAVWMDADSHCSRFRASNSQDH